MKIAISAAETSGDLIGAALVKSLITLNPGCQIEGLAGEMMSDEGCNRLWNMNHANVMGFSEVLKKLPSLLKLRSSIVTHYTKSRPDVFIGIDSPDFNFRIERKLKQNGIKTVHFISPSVWAWRSNRITKIKASTDLMLCLFPFEMDFYEKHGQKALFVGHPLAEIIKPRKQYLSGKRVLLMPGSREAEIKSLLPEIITSVKLMREQDPELIFSISLANNDFKDWVESQIGEQNIGLSIGDAHTRIANSDLVIVASGTATLEVAMIGVPMIVIYKISSASYQLVKRLLKTDYVSLPNVILGKEIVPELIQDNANGKNIADTAIQLINSNNSELTAQLGLIHKQLNQGASTKAAKAILEFVNE
ncbi:MAG: lipid-A-disaccharide synthase [Gammaproteobacteria bacterium]|jgi:lipid-A-disaccharide synthase|nr:lipid-A-disaccharide synthase [Gammaproteobacteria bacterium]MDP6974271.1 lipid-A-disaccharide synthase [Gammaproteobacteria bacterium]